MIRFLVCDDVRLLPVSCCMASPIRNSLLSETEVPLLVLVAFREGVVVDCVVGL
jgi:hypothetical protein